MSARNGLVKGTRAPAAGSSFPLLVALTLGVTGTQTAWAQAPAPIELVRQAVDAQGGVNAVRSLKRLSIKGEVRHWEPEESYVAGGQPVFTDHSSVVISWDLEHGTACTDWDRRIQFPAVTHDIYSEIVTSADVMWVTDQYSAGRDTRKSPGAVHLYETLKQLGVRPARFAGGHGSSGTYEEFEAIER